MRIRVVGLELERPFHLDEGLGHLPILRVLHALLVVSAVLHGRGRDVLKVAR